MTRSRLRFLGPFLGVILLGCGDVNGTIRSSEPLEALCFRRSSISASNLLGIERERPGCLPRSSGEGEPDTVRMLALRVEFQKDDDPQTTGDGTFDLSANTEATIDPPPHDYDYFERHLRALRNYYEAASHGKLIVVGSLYPLETDSHYAFTLPYPMSHYASGSSDEEQDSLLAVFFNDAIRVADASAPDMTFSTYDSYLVFHAGAGRESDLLHNSQKDIPSAFYSFDDVKRFLGRDDPDYEGIPVKDGFVREGFWLPETESQDGFQFGLNGMAAHHFAYQLGLPSLFNTESGRSGIGRWGLMDQGFDNELGQVPAQPCIWSKAFLGWSEPYEVGTKSENLDIAAWALNSGLIEAVKVAITPTEYFLIENRQQDTDGDTVLALEEGVVVAVDEYDVGVPGSGLLIWHIDEEVIAATYEDNRVNANPNHRGVDLEEADGVQEIGTSYGYIYGQKNDAFYTGNDSWDVANPLSQGISFTPTTHPNSGSNSGANSHVRVTDISASEPVMKLTVSIDTYQDGWPQFVGSAIGGNSPVFGDLDNNGDIEVVLTSQDGKVFVWDDDGSKLIDNADSVFIVGPRGDTTWVHVAVFAEAKDSIFSSPALGDLDGDGDLEVVVGSIDGKVCAWHHHDTDTDGRAEMLMGFPFDTQSPVSPPIVADVVDFEGIPPTPEIIVCTEQGDIFALNLQRLSSEPFVRFPGRSFSMSPAVANIAGDEHVELILVSKQGVVMAIDHTGTEMWSIELGHVPTCSPCIGDVDRDDEQEIVIVSRDGMMWVFDGDGHIAPGWPVEIRHPVESSPALGDIDGDGYVEIVLSGTDRIYAYNYNGSSLPNWPVTVDRRDPVGLIESSPVIGDVDGDGDLEIVVGSPRRCLLAYHHDGSVVEGFPLACAGTVASTPALLDVDGDGDSEVMAGSDDEYVYVWDLSGAHDEARIPWPMYAHDAQHTGAYPLAHLPPDIPEEELLSEASVYNFPNPTEGNSTLIRYRLGEGASVRIKIFNLAGELVDEFTGPGDPHTENEVRWNLQDFATGVYICRVEATGATGARTAFCKIAVVK